jgi:hypothetical protein
MLSGQILQSGIHQGGLATAVVFRHFVTGPSENPLVDNGMRKRKYDYVPHDPVCINLRVKHCNLVPNQGKKYQRKAKASQRQKIRSPTK